MNKFLVIDYETRSESDLKAIGGYEYSMHASTQIMCVAWRVGTKETLRTAETKSWSPAHGREGLKELVSLLTDSSLHYVAHNAFFEQVITRNVLSRYGLCREELTSIPHERWICTAARAAALALPRSLEGACVALKLQVQKDMDGRRLLLKMCKPRKATKHDDSNWHEVKVDLDRLVEYCKTDIGAEVELFLSTPPLNAIEQKVWALDQKINFRGVFVDRHLVAETLKMIEIETVNMTAELRAITKNEIDSISQRDRMLRYLYKIGVRLPDLQAKTVTDAIASGEHSGAGLRLLELKRDFGKTSTAKYSAFWERSKSDKRVRDSLLYWGASTGRWSGSGVQFQNLPRGSIKDTDASCAVVKSGDLDFVKVMYGNPMEVFSSNLRGCVIATPGKEIFCADYAAIEARVLFWVAGHEVGCKMFSDGVDLYKQMAVKIYNTELLKVTTPQRQLGKKAILGAGYGMGAEKFMDSCKQDGILVELDTSQLAIRTYRETHHQVPTLWRNLEKAAMAAVQNPGKVYTINKTKWFVKDGFLWCELPSKRRLAYYAPSIRPGTTKWKEKKDELWHYGLNPVTKQWEPQKTWGGTLTENVVQAVARDFMAEAMLRIESSGYELILSVHDELVAERAEGEGSLHEFETLMAGVPEWGAGCPIKVEGWVSKRYKK